MILNRSTQVALASNLDKKGCWWGSVFQDLRVTLRVGKKTCQSLYGSVKMKPLHFDTQNPEISGFSTVHAYKLNQMASKNEAIQQKNDIFVVKSPGYPCTRKA